MHPMKFALFGGILATLVMDLGAALARGAGLTAGLRPQWVAKWFGHLARGRLLHEDLRASPEVAFPLPLALAIHWAIGIVFAFGFAALMHHLAPSRPAAVVSAVAWGVATSVFAWFVMFPSMGFGAFGLRGPAELMLFRSSLINHVFYGVGLAIAWELARAYAQRAR